MVFFNFFVIFSPKKIHFSALVEKLVLGMFQIVSPKKKNVSIQNFFWKILAWY